MLVSYEEILDLVIEKYRRQISILIKLRLFYGAMMRLYVFDCCLEYDGIELKFLHKYVMNSKFRQIVPFDLYIPDVSEGLLLLKWTLKSAGMSLAPGGL